MLIFGGVPTTFQGNHFNNRTNASKSPSALVQWHVESQSAVKIGSNHHAPYNKYSHCLRESTPGPIFLGIRKNGGTKTKSGLNMVVGKVFYFFGISLMVKRILGGEGKNVFFGVLVLLSSRDVFFISSENFPPKKRNANSMDRS